MRAFHIAAEIHGRTARQAFSGEGGLYGMGRWHTPGRLIVYASQFLSLAALETLVHLPRVDRIQPFVAWGIEIPDDLVMPPPKLPATWKTDLKVTQSLGDAWLARLAAPVIRVPSAIVDREGESNFLLNPSHPKFSLKWVVSGPTPFVFDPRLTQR